MHRTDESTTFAVGKSYMTATDEEITLEACGLSQAFAGTIWNVAQVASFLIGGRAGGGETPKADKCGVSFILEDTTEVVK